MSTEAISPKEGLRQMANDCSSGTDDDEFWVLVLSRYERDNLLHLLNAVGWPYGNPHSDPALKDYNNGDWNGQLPQKLARLDKSYTIDGTDHPNFYQYRPNPNPGPFPPETHGLVQTMKPKE